MRADCPRLPRKRNRRAEGKSSLCSMASTQTNSWLAGDEVNANQQAAAQRMVDAAASVLGASRVPNPPRHAASRYLPRADYIDQRDVERLVSSEAGNSVNHGRCFNCGHIKELECRAGDSSQCDSACVFCMGFHKGLVSCPHPLLFLRDSDHE